MSPVEAGVTGGTAVPAQAGPPAQAESPAQAEPPASEFALPHEVLVDGVPIRYAVSGSGSRDLLLVHGYRAHHGWWYRVLPALEKRWRVIRLDISGHGDSGHRDHYGVDTWTAELIAVLDAAGSRHALLVGHSMGGRIAAVAGASHPDRFGGVVLLDSMLRPAGSPPPRVASLPAGREIVYESRAVAAARFRLRPPQPEPSAELVRPVAEYAVRPSTGAEGGWTWKFDQAGLPPIDNDRVVDSLARLRIPAWYVRAGRSLVVTDEVAAYARSALPAGSTFVTLPDAHHHLVLDAPDEFVRLLADLHGDLAASVRPRGAS
ncbi:alpha/beta hydrolase [Frankia sp. CNm7]|uniref:Alpha/beta hydrolase n=1 Tax=Frankia nepalensis TaxID=1836974 RepID=A0A937UV23_9ACTN|nr:alpha/beta hydrolase [Frankia nepalensis]MBL7497396.1 alpha/beta hydrolase [Frankia nepalensis]MBL7512099.1 alpha/beta hydrolase [Frankia nepalensis]MBL7520006.1 alpha/beta hydrolase [Frankia nepalensis]MBL7631801.1 alpha/beta hydrolase [Frankia nepalensis]